MYVFEVPRYYDKEVHIAMLMNMWHLNTFYTMVFLFPKRVILKRQDCICTPKTMLQLQSYKFHQ